MSFFIADAAAQSADAAAGQSPMSFLIMMLVMFGVMYFVAIRPQMKRAKEHRALIESLAKGDEIVTNGGIGGRVVDLGDAFITVEIATNTQIKVQRHAIAAVLPKGTLKSS